MRYGHALIAVGLLLGASALNAQPTPTLVLEFEGGFDGVGLDGTVKPTLEGRPELADGKFGRAMLTGPNTG